MQSPVMNLTEKNLLFLKLYFGVKILKYSI